MRSRRWIIVIVISGVLLSVGGAGVTTAQVDAQGSPDISASTVNSEVTPGSEAELTIELNNDGELQSGNNVNRDQVTTARGVIVTIESTNAPVSFDTKRKTVGTVTESELEDVTFDIEVPADAEMKTYDIDVDISYSYTAKTISNKPNTKSVYEAGSRTQSDTVELELSNDPRFSVVDVESTLRVGEEGTLSGQIKNIGGEDATDTQITFDPDGENINPLESSIALGDINAGETTEFSIPVEVTADAESVPQQFDLPVTFRDRNGIRGSDDDPEFTASISAQRDAFLIEPVDSSVEAGGSRVLDIEVTNNLGEPVSDIEGKLFADDPLDSSNDETFTESLDPGETTTVTVDLSAASGATIKNYPASMDFRYTDADGDSKLTDSYRLAVSVTEPTDDGGGLPIGPLLLILLVVAGGGAFLWRRNNDELDDIGGLRDE